MKHITLIACCKTKKSAKSPAEELYRGNLFKKSLRYAKTVLKPDAIFILSAKHGLVSLQEMLDPYEETLKGKRSAHKKEWTKKVVEQLSKVADLHNDKFTILAGNDYNKYLLDEQIMSCH